MFVIMSYSTWVSFRTYFKQRYLFCLNRDSSAVDNKILAIFTVGEAWHNFHHCFPTDYKTSELPFYSFNLSTAFIDFFAWVGWATDLKTVSKEAIQRRMERTGDGSGLHHHHHYAIEESESELSSDENLDEDVFNNNNGEVKGQLGLKQTLLVKANFNNVATKYCFRV